MLLWGESDEEADRIGQEFTASYPCTYAPQPGRPDAPKDEWLPQEPDDITNFVGRICAILDTKMTHDCRTEPGACRHKV